MLEKGGTEWSLQKDCRSRLMQLRGLSAGSGEKPLFDENRFSSISRPKDIIPNLEESQMDDHSDDVPVRLPSLEEISWIPILILPLVLKDPRTYNEAVQCIDAAFSTEAIENKLVLLWKIIHGFLSDLPPVANLYVANGSSKEKMKV
ncbi:hypothetical protein Tco_1502310 [Tanacetum coccineum]